MLTIYCILKISLSRECNKRDNFLKINETTTHLPRAQWIHHHFNAYPIEANTFSFHVLLSPKPHIKQQIYFFNSNDIDVDSDLWHDLFVSNPNGRKWFQFQHSFDTNEVRDFTWMDGGSNISIYLNERSDENDNEVNEQK